MSQLTKLDVKAIRNADTLCVHLGKHTAVRLIKRGDRLTDPFARDVEYVIEAPVGLHGYRGVDELKAGLVECFGMVNLYWSQNHTACLALKTLREGDEISFTFWPDAHSNGYLALVNLHGDSLYMHVRRDGKMIANWELETNVCPSNSARMCKGIPDSESYRNAAAEARAA